MENEDKEKAKKVFPLGKDLALSPIAGLRGYILGRVAAYVFPFAIPHYITEIRKNGIHDFSGFLGHMGATAGYVHGWYEIVSNIVKNPRDVSSYIPIATNGVVLALGGIKLLSDRRKKRGKLEAELSRSHHPCPLI